MAPTSTPAAGAQRGRTAAWPAFHALRVADERPLCADAVAVELRDPRRSWPREYAYRPGQSPTLRRTVDGRDERRSYSICAPAGAPPRIGVREVPGGLFSDWLVHEVRPRRHGRGAAADRRLHPGPGRARAPRADRRGPRDHPDGVHRRARCWPPTRARGPPFYGNSRTEHGDVRRRAGRPEGPLPGPLAARPRALPRAARGRAALRAPGRRPARRADRRPGATRESANHWWLCGPHGMVTDAQAVLAGLGVPGRARPPGAVLRRATSPCSAGGTPRGDWPRGPASARSPSPSTAARHRRAPLGDATSSTAPSAPAPTCRSPARAGSAHVPGPGHRRARSTCAATSRWKRPRWTRLRPTCQSLPVSEKLTVDYDA